MIINIDVNNNLKRELFYCSSCDYPFHFSCVTEKNVWVKSLNPKTDFICHKCIESAACALDFNGLVSEHLKSGLNCRPVFRSHEYYCVATCHWCCICLDHLVKNLLQKYSKKEKFKIIAMLEMKRFGIVDSDLFKIPELSKERIFNHSIGFPSQRDLLFRKEYPQRFKNSFPVPEMYAFSGEWKQSLLYIKKAPLNIHILFKQPYYVKKEKKVNVYAIKIEGLYNDKIDDVENHKVFFVCSYLVNIKIFFPVFY